MIYWKRRDPPGSQIDMAALVQQDGEAAAMGGDGGDVGASPSPPTASTQSALEEVLL